MGDNRQNTNSSSSSVNLGYSGANTMATLAQNAVSNGLGNMGGGAGIPENGSQSGKTQSVISAGNIVITGTGNAEKDAQSTTQVASLTSRDAKTANQTLSNTLTLQQAQAVQEQQKVAQENLQAANLVGAAMDGMIGDLAISNQWRTGSPQATLLHGLSGVIQASIGGTNLGSGFASAVVNEQAIGAMSDYLESKGIKRYINGDPSKPNTEYNELMKAGSALVGVATAAALGGNKADMAAGGHIAKNATEFNALVHDQRLAVLNATKAGKTPRQQQALSDAACALAKCAQGLDPNDPNTAAQIQSQFRGEANTPEAIAARNSLVLNGFETRTTLEAVTDTVKYLRALASDDVLKAYNGANNLGTLVLNDFKLALQKSGGPQLPDDFGRSDGPNTGGGAAAVVTPSVVLCTPAGVCVLIPPIGGLTSTSPLPSGWTLSQSGGSDNGNSNNSAAPVASGGNGVGGTGVNGETPLFRGGNSLDARFGVDVKAASDGLIHPTATNGKPQGLSLNLNPNDPFIQKYGGAFPVDSVPEGLQVVQSGKPGHYVIAPSAPMTFEKYQQLLSQVQLRNFNLLP